MKKDECLKFSRFTEGNMTFGQGLMKMFDDELGSSQRAYPEPFVGRPRCAHEGTDFTNIDDAAKAGIHLSLEETVDCTNSKCASSIATYEDAFRGTDAQLEFTVRRGSNEEERLWNSKNQEKPIRILMRKAENVWRYEGLFTIKSETVDMIEDEVVFELQAFDRKRKRKDTNPSNGREVACRVNEPSITWRGSHGRPSNNDPSAIDIDLVEGAEREETEITNDISGGKESVAIPVFDERPESERSDSDLKPHDFVYITSTLAAPTCAAKELLRWATNRSDGVCSYASWAEHAYEAGAFLKTYYDAGIVEHAPFRIVSRGVQVPLAVFWTGDARHYGVRTQRKIQRGRFVCEYVGELKHDQEEASREYCFDLDHFENRHKDEKDTIRKEHEKKKDNLYFVLDAYKKGNVALWINAPTSGEDKNLRLQPVYTPDTGHSSTAFYRLCLFATRDIAAGEELLYEYGPDFWKE